MLHVHSIVLVPLVLLAGCRAASSTASATGAATGPRERPSRVKLLAFDGCPMVTEMRANLTVALAKVGADPAYEQIDLESLPAEHPLLRYGSPTVLLDDVDLMGASPSGSAALTCRMYPDGVPDADELARRLRARTPIVEISADERELATAFNDAQGQTRLVVIVSPT